MPTLPRRSAGLLLFRRRGSEQGTEAGVEVMLVHMGGPFWARKDEGAWSIPKGEYGDDEEPLAVARREFEEEIGRPPPAGPLLELGEVRQSGGKVVAAWALEADVEVSEIESNTFEIEWPPRSGRMREFPEVDRADWFDLDTARTKLVRAQGGLLDALLERLGSRVLNRPKRQCATTAGGTCRRRLSVRMHVTRRSSAARPRPHRGAAGPPSAGRRRRSR
jgi:predicted NUDIX family NTP pyrophosphohydrolase